MAVLRVNKTSDYTVMSNAHFKERDMSLKAKGLLSLMLSLPDDWDYSINGLCAICKESQTAIRSTLGELEKFGYLIRQRVKDEKGQFDYVYDIFEKPQMKTDQHEDALDAENPYAGNPYAENLYAENHIQLNTNNQITKEENTNQSNTKEKKKERKTCSFDAMLDEFAKGDPVVRDLLGEWLKVRKAKRAAMTDRAIELNLKKLDGLAAGSSLSVQDYLTEIICRGWTAFYPIYSRENGKTQKSTGTNVFLEIAKEQNLF